MAWYNPWSSKGQGSDGADQSQPQQSQPQPQQQSPSASTSSSAPAAATASSRPQAKHAFQPQAPAHTGIETSPELFRRPPPLAEGSTMPVSQRFFFSPQAYLSCISPTIPLAGFGLGSVSGFMSASKRTSLVFLAENAHRKPTTMQGWYFYNKTKNYRVLWDAIKGGIKGGTKVGVWCSLFTLFDSASLYARVVGWDGSNLPTTSSEEGEKLSLPTRSTEASLLGHWTDGLVAGGGTAIVASIIYRTSPVRFLLIGTHCGVAMGILQDWRDWLVQRHQQKEIGEGKVQTNEQASK